MIATLFSSRMRALPCVLAVSTARRRARASRPPSEKLDAARDGVGISGGAEAQAAARAAGAVRAARAAVPARAAPRPPRVPEGPRRPARRAGGAPDRHAPGVRGGARPLLHGARVRDARGALRPRESPRPRPRAWRAELFGSAKVPGADFNDAVLGPLTGLRAIYRQSLRRVDKTARAMHGKAFVRLEPAEQDAVFALLDSGPASVRFAPDPRRGVTFIDLLVA